MYYIGISAYYHEASVFLTDGKKNNCFVKEEYFTRIKGDKNFPKRSLEYLLDKFDLNENNITSVCFYEKPFKSWWEIFKYSMKKPYENKQFLKHHLQSFNSGSTFFYTHLNKVIKIPRAKILYSSHHLSHALYGALYVKNPAEYVFVTCDGVGEGESMAIYSIDNDNLIRKHWTNFYPNSLGLFYSAITEYLGFNINDGEFKVMSLSSYGKPIYEDQMSKIFDSENFTINKSYFDFQKNPKQSFSSKFLSTFGKPYLDLSVKKNFETYSNIACSAQIILKKTMKNLINKAMKITGKKKIVLTGGVALNCKLTYELSKENLFKELLVPPSPGDAGSAIGATNLSYYIENKQFLNSPGLFPGPSKKNININFKVDEFFKRISSQNDFIDLCSKKILDGNIISTYIEKTETGPRALGNTSILCNPKNKMTVLNLNNKIKKREIYQPLAPMLLQEDFSQYFTIENSIYKNLFSMGTLCEAKKKLYLDYNSIIHIDGTCRVQIISDQSSLIYKLLKKLRDDDVDILVNTSFNISKDPIVFDLYDVYTNMKRMNIKYIIMDEGLFEIKDI